VSRVRVSTEKKKWYKFCRSEWYPPGYHTPEFHILPPFFIIIRFLRFYTAYDSARYDRQSGIAFSFFVGLSRGIVVLASLAMTIKSASMISPPSPPPGPAPGIPGFPIESVLLGIAITAATLTILRNRRTSSKIAV